MIAEILQSLPQDILDQVPAKARQGYELAGRGVLQIIETVALEEQDSCWQFFYRTLEDYECEAADNQTDNINCIRRYQTEAEVVIVTAKKTPQAKIGMAVDFDVVSLATLESLTH